MYEKIIYIMHFNNYADIYYFGNMWYNG